MILNLSFYFTENPQTLSEVYSHYYSSIVPTNQNSHYTKRFTNFAIEWDLIDAQGTWLGSSNSNNSAFISRIQAFSKFFYLAKKNKFTTFSLGSELWTDLTQSPIFLTQATPIYSNSHVQYVLDKFYQFVQTGYSNE